MMKSLKPFSHTFFSEWYLSPNFDQEDRKKKSEDAKVGELISFEDKGKGRQLDEDEPWTTQSGTEGGFHTGLCVRLVIRELLSAHSRILDSTEE